MKNVPLSCPGAQRVLPISHLPKQNQAEGGTAEIEVNPLQLSEQMPTPVFLRRDPVRHRFCRICIVITAKNTARRARSESEFCTCVCVMIAISFLEAQIVIYTHYVLYGHLHLYKGQPVRAYGFLALLGPQK